MRRFKPAAAIASAATIGLLLSAPSFAQDSGEEQFGRVHFATSCNEVAQRRFDRAMRYQHSFWYRPAKELFEEALSADPDCAVAYWGMALSLLFITKGPPPAPNLAQGLEA